MKIDRAGREHADPYSFDQTQKFANSHPLEAAHETSGSSDKTLVPVGLALVLILAMALGHIRAGRLQPVRSPVRTIPATG